MNKKLIAAAIAAVMAAPVVSAADTTLYGKAHLQIDMADQGGTEDSTVNSRGSRLGVKGSEDLGNGLKAIFQYEIDMNGFADRAITGTMRNSFVGLSGDFGTVLAGAHDTPAKVALYATGAEMLADSVIELTGNGLGNMEETRSGNAIAYISPSFSGFSGAIAVIPTEGEAAPGDDSLTDSWSAGVMYSGMGFKVGLGYEDVENNWEIWNVGASYTFDAFTIGALYQDQESSVAGSTAESEMWAISGKAKFGNNAVIVSYSNTESSAGAISDAANPVIAAGEGSGFGLAVTHAFSKRSQVYVAYANKDVDGAANSVRSVGSNVFSDGDVISIGMIHDF